MVFKLPNKEQVKFARSAFRELLAGLNNANKNINNVPVLSQLQNAVTKPGVDPRKLALEITRTGRIDGKKVSSNQRREVATLNDYINNRIMNTEDFYYSPFQTYRRKEMGKVPQEVYSDRLYRRTNNMLDRYERKLSEGTLRPEDIPNIQALLTMQGNRLFEVGKPTMIKDVIKPKFPPNVYSLRYPNKFTADDVIEYDTPIYKKANKLDEKTGKKEFLQKTAFKRDKTPGADYRSYDVGNVLDIIKENKIPRTKEIDEMIVALLPEWEGSAEGFVKMIVSLLGS